MVRKYGIYPTRTSSTGADNRLETWEVMVWHDSPTVPPVPALPAGAAPDCKCIKQTTASPLGGNVWETTFTFSNDREVVKVSTLHAELLDYQVSATYDAGTSYEVNATYKVDNDKRLLFLANPPADPSGLNLPLNGLSPSKSGLDWIYSANFFDGSAGEAYEPEMDGQEATDEGEAQEMTQGSIVNPLSDSEIAALINAGEVTSEELSNWRDWWKKGMIIERLGNAYKHIRGLQPVALGHPYAIVKAFCEAPQQFTVFFCGLMLSQISTVRVKQPQDGTEKKPQHIANAPKPTDSPDGLITGFDTAYYTADKLLTIIKNKYIFDWQPAGMEFRKLRKKIRRVDPEDGLVYSWNTYEREVHWESTLIVKP